jgi:hypothetical protein
VAATLRLPAEYPDYREALRTAFSELYEWYGAGYFDVSVTANVILRGQSERTFSVFYGQDFSTDEIEERDFSMIRSQRIKDMSQAYRLRINYTAADFGGAFFSYFDDSDVSVYGVVNIVYVMKRVLDNFSVQKKLGRGGPRGRMVIVY